MIELIFSNPTNTELTVYDNGFQQRIYFEADLTKPNYDITKEVSEDITRVAHLDTIAWAKYYEFTLAVVPEYCLNTLFYASLHNVIQVINPLGSLVTITEMSVTYEQLDDCFFSVQVKLYVDSYNST